MTKDISNLQTIRNYSELYGDLIGYVLDIRHTNEINLEAIRRREIIEQSILERNAVLQVGELTPIYIKEKMQKLKEGIDRDEAYLSESSHDIFSELQDRYAQGKDLLKRFNASPEKLFAPEINTLTRSLQTLEKKCKEAFTELFLGLHTEGNYQIPEEPTKKETYDDLPF